MRSMKGVYSILTTIWLVLIHTFLGFSQDAQMCAITPGVNNEYDFNPDALNLNTFSIDGSSFVTNGSLFKYVNGEHKALVSAEFTSESDSNAGWNLELYLHQGLIWNDWSNQQFPTGYLDEYEIVTDEYESWMYYIIECGSLTGWGTYEGAHLELSHSPSSNFYAIQIGENTNGLNSEMGLMGWATGIGTVYSESTETLVENEEAQFTFRLSLGECEESSSPESIDLSGIQNTSLSYCLFNGLFLTGVQQTENNEISIVQTAGCPVEFDFTLGQDIFLPEASVGYHEFIITYDGPCSEYQEQTFSITINPCEDTDFCLPFSAGENIFVFDCDTTPVTLNAQIHCELEGTWEVINTTGELSNENDPNSLFYPDLGANSLAWHSTCGNSLLIDTVVVVLYSSGEPISNVGADKSLVLCESLEVSLSSNINFPFEGFWEQLSGPPVELDDSLSFSPTFNATEIGEYVFSWGYYDQCQQYSFDTQSVTVLDNSLNAGLDEDGNLCDGLLEICSEPDIISPELKNFYWESIGAQITIVNPFNPFSCFQFEEAGDYAMTLNIEDGCGNLISDTVNYTVFNQLEPDENCQDFSIIEVNGVPETFGITGQQIPNTYSGSWSQLSGETILVFEDSTEYSTSISNMNLGSYIIEWSIEDPNCGYAFSCFQNLEFMPEEIPGCTLPFSMNYNSLATIDDGSCEFDFTICDCNNNSHSPYSVLDLGNGIPNNNSTLNFNCDTWGYDCGDLTESPNEDPFDVCNYNLPPENGCSCEIEQIELELGETFLVLDSVYINGEWNETEICYSTILIDPTESGVECDVTSISYNHNNLWTTINLEEQGFNYTTYSTIALETAVNDTEISIYISTGEYESEEATIYIPVCVVGVNEQSSLFSLFPNPAEELVQIQSQSGLNYDVLITDMNGREVYSANGLSESTIISFTEAKFESGLYIVRLIYNKGIIEEKLIISRP